jgi:hypothetical protein
MEALSDAVKVPSDEPAKAKRKPRKRKEPKMAKNAKPRKYDAKIGAVVDTDVMVSIRKLRARLELRDGKRRTIADTVNYAVKAALR